jgi:hypothetical protein
MWHHGVESGSVRRTWARHGEFARAFLFGIIFVMITDMLMRAPVCAGTAPAAVRHPSDDA